jgi:hypothetical protein
MQYIVDISTNFQLSEKCTYAEIHHSGHIHTTYLLGANGSNSSPQYIMQKVNQSVFPRPGQLAENIRSVTEHIRRKAISLGRDPLRVALTMVPTMEDEFIHTDQDGSIWRMYEFIPGTRTYEEPQNKHQVYQAGLAIGDFLNLLEDFPTGDLFETIPDFHNTPHRFSAFKKTLNADSKGRAMEIQPEIDFVLERQSEMSQLVDMLASGDLPLRVTHNDTKISNVLFDPQTCEAVCMIDLDTVMPGTLLYDFGDAARTMTNTTAEDEPNLALVDFNMDYFEQLARGFIQKSSGILTSEELSLLPFSTILLTLECGMRFLKDYLQGDIYFHTSRENHNLDRARVQFKLIEGMEYKLTLMNEVIKSVG